MTICTHPLRSTPALKKIDQFIRRLDSTPLSLYSRQRLIPLLSDFKGKIAPPLTLHDRPAELPEEFDQLLWTMTDRAMENGNRPLIKGLIKLQSHLNDYMLADADPLGEKLAVVALRIRANQEYGLAPDDFNQLFSLASAIVQSSQAYRQAMLEFREHVVVLKDVLKSEKQQFVEQVIAPRGEQVRVKYHSVMIITGLTLLCTLVVAFSLGGLFSRNFSRPLIETVEVIKLLGKNDFSQRVKVGAEDEVGQVGRAVNGYADYLQDILQQLSSEMLVRKEAEEESRASEWKYRQLSQEFETLLEGISDSIILFSPAAEVVWANQGTNLQLNDRSVNFSAMFC